MADTPLERIASNWWVPALIGVLSIAVGILAGILFIVRGVFEMAVGWELRRIHAT